MSRRLPSAAGMPSGLTRGDQINWRMMRQEIESERHARQKAEKEVAHLQERLRAAQDAVDEAAQGAVQIRELIRRIEVLEAGWIALKRVAAKAAMPVASPALATSPPPTTTAPANDTADLLYGAPRIGAHMGIGTAAVRHLISSGRLPAFKIGGRVCARRSEIDAWLVAAGEARNG